MSYVEVSILALVRHTYEERTEGMEWIYDAGDRIPHRQSSISYTYCA